MPSDAPELCLSKLLLPADINNYAFCAAETSMSTIYSDTCGVALWVISTATKIKNSLYLKLQLLHDEVHFLCHYLSCLVIGVSE